MPCEPADAPETCLTDGVLCYANRSREGRRFVEAPRQTGFVARFAETWAWTMSSRAEMVHRLSELDWKPLRIARFSDPVPIVRYFERIDWVYMLRSDDQLVVYMWHPAADAVLRIETAVPMTGRIVDPETGETLQTVVTGQSTITEIEVPGPRGEAVLVLSRSGRAR